MSLRDLAHEYLLMETEQRDKYVHIKNSDSAAAVDDNRINNSKLDIDVHHRYGSAAHQDDTGVVHKLHGKYIGNTPLNPDSDEYHEHMSNIKTLTDRHLSKNGQHGDSVMTNDPASLVYDHHHQKEFSLYHLGINGQHGHGGKPTGSKHGQHYIGKVTTDSDTGKHNISSVPSVESIVSNKHAVSKSNKPRHIEFKTGDGGTKGVSIAGRTSVSSTTSPNSNTKIVHGHAPDYAKPTPKQLGDDHISLHTALAHNGKHHKHVGLTSTVGNRKNNKESNALIAYGRHKSFGFGDPEYRKDGSSVHHSLGYVYRDHNNAQSSDHTPISKTSSQHGKLPKI
jgi:hypothetical protein